MLAVLSPKQVSNSLVQDDTGANINCLETIEFVLQSNNWKYEIVFHEKEDSSDSISKLERREVLLRLLPKRVHVSPSLQLRPLFFVVVAKPLHTSLYSETGSTSNDNHCDNIEHNVSNRDENKSNDWMPTDDFEYHINESYYWGDYIKFQCCYENGTLVDEFSMVEKCHDDEDYKNEAVLSENQSNDLHFNCNTSTIKSRPMISHDSTFDDNDNMENRRVTKDDRYSDDDLESGECLDSCEVDEGEDDYDDYEHEIEAVTCPSNITFDDDNEDYDNVVIIAPISYEEDCKQIIDENCNDNGLRTPQINRYTMDNSANRSFRDEARLDHTCSGDSSPSTTTTTTTTISTRTASATTTSSILSLDNTKDSRYVQHSFYNGRNTCANNIHNNSVYELKPSHHLLMVISTESTKLEIGMQQTYVTSTLKQYNIAYTTIDIDGGSTASGKKESRSKLKELWKEASRTKKKRISVKKNRYPQFFIITTIQHVSNDMESATAVVDSKLFQTTRTDYWGDIKRFLRSEKEGTLVHDLVIAPAENLLITIPATNQPSRRGSFFGRLLGRRKNQKSNKNKVNGTERGQDDVSHNPIENNISSCTSSGGEDGIYSYQESSYYASTTTDGDYDDDDNDDDEYNTDNDDDNNDDDNDNQGMYDDYDNDKDVNDKNNKNSGHHDAIENSPRTKVGRIMTMENGIVSDIHVANDNSEKINIIDDKDNHSSCNKLQKDDGLKSDNVNDDDDVDDPADQTILTIPSTTTTITTTHHDSDSHSQEELDGTHYRLDNLDDESENGVNNSKNNNTSDGNNSVSNYNGTVENENCMNDQLTANENTIATLIINESDQSSNVDFPINTVVDSDPITAATKSFELDRSVLREDIDNESNSDNKTSNVVDKAVLSIGEGGSNDHLNIDSVHGDQCHDEYSCVHETLYLNKKVNHIIENTSTVVDDETDHDANHKHVHDYCESGQQNEVVDVTLATSVVNIPVMIAAPQITSMNSLTNEEHIVENPLLSTRAQVSENISDSVKISSSTLSSPGCSRHDDDNDHCFVRHESDIPQQNQWIESTSTILPGPVRIREKSPLRAPKKLAVPEIFVQLTSSNTSDSGCGTLLANNRKSVTIPQTQVCSESANGISSNLPLKATKNVLPPTPNRLKVRSSLPLTVESSKAKASVHALNLSDKTKLSVNTHVVPTRLLDDKSPTPSEHSSITDTQSSCSSNFDSNGNTTLPSSPKKVNKLTLPGIFREKATTHCRAVDSCNSESARSSTVTNDIGNENEVFPSNQKEIKNPLHSSTISPTKKKVTIPGVFAQTPKKTVSRLEHLVVSTASPLVSLSSNEQQQQHQSDQPSPNTLDVQALPKTTQAKRRVTIPSAFGGVTTKGESNGSMDTSTVAVESNIVSDTKLVTTISNEGCKVPSSSPPFSPPKDTKKVIRARKLSIPGIFGEIESKECKKDTFVSAPLISPITTTKKATKVIGGSPGIHSPTKENKTTVNMNHLKLDTSTTKIISKEQSLQEPIRSRKETLAPPKKLKNLPGIFSEQISPTKSNKGTLNMNPATMSETYLSRNDCETTTKISFKKDLPNNANDPKTSNSLVQSHEDHHDEEKTFSMNSIMSEMSPSFRPRGKISIPGAFLSQL